MSSCMTDSYLQLRYAVWRAAVVVYGEVQLLQQDAPAAGVVVLGDSEPAPAKKFFIPAKKVCNLFPPRASYG